MPTQRKIDQVAAITALIARAEITISTAYQGVPMAKQNELRQQLHEAGAEMLVVKNTLLRLAAERAGQPEFAQLADGPTALVVGVDGPVSAAKALTAFIRANDQSKVAVRRAVLGGEIVDESYVRDLATVPSRDELASKLAGNVVAKIAEFSGLLIATQREFAGLVEARAKQLEDAA
ncbi:MAG: 50S ribosomal protein L10 [Dehalococcoidia bacterium]